MKLTVNIPTVVELRKSEKYPSCYEYDFNGQTYICTPRDIARYNIEHKIILDPGETLNISRINYD